MPRVARVLGDKEVRALRESGFYRVGAVTGLGLQITKTGAKSWVLRYRIAGKDREMGLGSFRDVGVAKARELAREAREQISQDIDPIQAAAARRSQLIASRAMDVTRAREGRCPAWRCKINVGC